MRNDQDGLEQHPDFTELLSKVTVTVERLKVVMDTTREIKEQLIILNGRVRTTETDLAAVKANPLAAMRDYCDGKRARIEARLDALEGRVPSIIQSVFLSLLTGGALALVYYLLNKLP